MSVVLRMGGSCTRQERNWMGTIRSEEHEQCGMVLVPQLPPSSSQTLG